MKIAKTTKDAFGNIVITNGEKKTVEGATETFDVRLKKASSENYETRIASILEQISVQAEKMSKKVDIKELRAYKKLVSEFLDEAVYNSHKFTKENKLDRRGRHRVYALVKQINKNLEDLTQEVLKEEKDNLLILQKLDDIRGLMLDICT